MPQPIHLIAVGAPGQTVREDAGAGRVFLFDAYGYLEGSIEAPRDDPTAIGEAGAGFGFATATTGGYAVGDAVLAASAPGKDVNGLADQGRVYLYSLARTDDGWAVSATHPSEQAVHP